MEEREDLRSILPWLPLIARSGNIFWAPQALEDLRALSRGPESSGVDSGEALSDFISGIRGSIGLSRERLAFNAAGGYALFFDDLMSSVASRELFGDTVPALANLLLRLPTLLEWHYLESDRVFGDVGEGAVIRTGLRILQPQEAGIVFLSQECIGALLACSFFCLFPSSNRGEIHLPTINFDHLFAGLYNNGKPNQEQKILSLIHYFHRICSCMPKGFVSFERKVLPLEQNHLRISYLQATFWNKSTAPLCSLEVLHSGFIEDQHYEALEVDFSNEYLGGGALHRGCVQL